MQINTSSLLSDKRIEHAVAAIGSIAVAVALVKTTLALVKSKVKRVYSIYNTFSDSLLGRYITFGSLQTPVYRIYLFILFKSIAIRKNQYRKIWICISYAFTWCYHYYCWCKGCS